MKFRAFGRQAGLEVSVTPQVTVNYTLVGFGSGQETNYDLLSSDIFLDRMYLHGTHEARIFIALQDSQKLGGNYFAEFDEDILESSPKMRHESWST